MFRLLGVAVWIVGALAQSRVPNTDVLRQAVERDPGDAEAHRRLGQAYFRERQSKLALDEYQTALRLAPQNETLYLESAAIFLSAGRAEQAETVLSEAARRFPNSNSTQYNLLYHDLAELWTATGRLRKARDAMTTALRVNGPVAPATLYKRIGDFNTDLLDLDGALSAYSQALKLDPENLITHLAVGNLHLKRNSSAQAIEEFERVLARDKANVAALSGMAEAHYRMGQLKDAVTEAEKVIQIQPDHLSARYIRGTALVRLNRKDEGQKELQEYRRLQGIAEAENHRLREIQTFNATGISRLLEGRYEEAIAVFKAGVDAYPGVPDLYVNLGLAQSQSGQHRAAIATFQQLLDRKLGSDTLLHRYLAQEYSSLGETEAAERHQTIYLQQLEEELGAKPGRQ